MKVQAFIGKGRFPESSFFKKKKLELLKLATSYPIKSLILQLDGVRAYRVKDTLKAQVVHW